MTEWRTIDSAPRDSTNLLLYSPFEGIFIGSNGTPSLGWLADDGDSYAPTHWQPLPDDPL